MNRRNTPVRPVLSIALSILLVFATAINCDSISAALLPLTKLTAAVGAPGEYVSLLTDGLEGEPEPQQPLRTLTFNGFGGGAESEIKPDTELTAVSADISALMTAAAADVFEKSGDILEKQFTAADANTVAGLVAVSNKTSEHSADISALLSTKTDLGDEYENKPLVLIYHTHSTEGFEMLDNGWYSDDYESRTYDINRSIVRVGTEIAERLQAAGINVIHDTTIHDTSYNGSYARSAETVKGYLEKYPSILLTLDVHRDAIHYDNGTKVKPTAVIGGKKAAQVMIIAGCEEGDITDFPNWEDNLALAVKLQNTCENTYAGLMRPIFFCRRKYNMHLSRYSMLLEFGTDANTLDEAVFSGRLIGNALAKLIKEECSNG